MPSNASSDPSKPPEFGEIEITLPLAPVSVQAKKKTRDALIEALRAFTRPLKYLLTGDVTIDLFWHLHGDLRYESDTAPDIENITKPLIDGLCGPEGLLIDDCQISAFGSEWVSWLRDDQQVTLRIKYAPDHWMPKPILFVQIDKALCLPLEADLGRNGQCLMVEAYKNAIAVRQEFVNLGVDNFYSRATLPVHRVFHRTRIHGFNVVDVSTLEDQIGTEAL